MHRILKHKRFILLVAVLSISFSLASLSPVYADTCGAGEGATKTSIEIGCVGKGNAITDVTFAIIRFLSAGVGLVVIGSIIVGGIQYSASRGEPQATAQAIHRIQSALIALVIYIFSYAILNYIIPAGFLK